MKDSPTSATLQTAPERSLWFFLRTALSLAVLLLVVGAGTVLIVLPKVAGAIPRTVLTQSMEPVLPPGTLIVVRPVKPDQVAVGDVVTYQIESGKPDVITHRVIAIDFTPSGTRSFTFKGDNNAVADADPVREVQIVGRLWYSIPLIGYLSLWLNGDARAVIVPVLAGLLFLFAAYMFASGIVGAVRGRRRERDDAPVDVPGAEAGLTPPVDETPVVTPATRHPASPARFLAPVAVGLLLGAAAYLLITGGSGRGDRLSRD
ncbi:signal peptidase I [Lacisediminihabitans profunda]|uniref:signal peptidase I n=1 Tax=Lacisediminihabitans profunda TaxID=2594790 RepID=UPI001FE66C17|nr:signal peptidase I [Lacisediminihabitans profunda]